MYKSLKFVSLPFVKLIALLGCLTMSSQSISQTVYPHLTVLNGDTLAVFSLNQYEAVRFSIGYIRHLQKLDTLHVAKVYNLDAQIHVKDNVIALERFKTAENEAIIMNLESVVKEYKTTRRRQRVKSTFTYIGLGLIAGAEAGVITYLLIR